MGTRKARPLPARLERAQQRFERWRQTRKIPSRIPGPLWALAARIASVCGISRTAKALRVNYRILKQRVDHDVAARSGLEKSAAEPRRPSLDGARSVPGFLELAPPMPVGSCQCILELEDNAGAKMRVSLQSAETPDLAALSRSFWELRS
jgi:hypothetical protein